MNIEHKCAQCGKMFRVPANLKRHQERKTRCAPILDSQGGNACRYCGRTFASTQSMNRHVRQYCKIANSDEGMEKLLDYTLARQLAELEHRQNSRIDELAAQVARMNVATAAPSHVFHAPVTNTVHAPVTNTVNTTVININAWDGDRRIVVDVAHILGAFAENPRLQEYARLGDHELADIAKAPPYVTELLMDLTKRAHADPAARNVYLNPKRADQVLVHKKIGTWEVLPLAEATRLIFDGVAKSIHRIVMTEAERRQLPIEAQNALAIAGLMYDDEPEGYTARAKAPMSAHLANACRALA